MGFCYSESKENSTLGKHLIKYTLTIIYIDVLASYGTKNHTQYIIYGICTGTASRLLAVMSEFNMNFW